MHAVTDERLDLNTASAEALGTIPGMTKRMVREFREYRPYVSIQQFRKELGKYVSAGQIAKWEPHIYVPVAYDSCDAPTLSQLPGVGPEQATALMAGRPYGSRDAFLAALKTQVGAEDSTKGAGLVR